MRPSEWPREYTELQHVEIRNNMVYVKSSRGACLGLVGDTGIVDAKWIADAVIVYYRNGVRVRYYGPYGSQREQI